jgi:hypothetical protein
MLLWHIRTAPSISVSPYNKGSLYVMGGTWLSEAIFLWQLTSCASEVG